MRSFGTPRVAVSRSPSQVAANAVREAGLTLQIDTAVTRVSARALPTIGTLVARFAPALWDVRAAVAPSPDAQLLEPEQYEAMLHYLCSWRARTGLAVQTTAAPTLRRVTFERAAVLPRAQRTRTRRAVGAPSSLSLNGKGIVFIAHTGDVYPSEFLPCIAGNVRRTPLAEIYRAAPLFRELRAYWRLRGKCGACPFYVASGGSRARAYAVSGDLLGEDRSCGYQPLGYATPTQERPVP